MELKRTDMMLEMTIDRKHVIRTHQVYEMNCVLAESEGVPYPDHPPKLLVIVVVGGGHFAPVLWHGVVTLR